MAELRVNRAGERVMSIGGGCLLVAGVVAFDQSTRQRVVNVLSGNAGAEASAVSGMLRQMSTLLTDTIGFQTSEHGVLATFAVAAVVLFVFMLRV